MSDLAFGSRGFDESHEIGSPQHPGFSSNIRGMYTPSQNRNDDPAELLAFMRRYSFATLVTSCGGLMATHLPVNVSERDGRFHLTGHLSKANPQWRELSLGEAMVVFAEPHAYVSPANYGDGMWVPTWNYVAIHAYGAPALVEDRDATLAILRETIAATEPGYGAEFATYPADWVDAKLKGIVAFEMDVTRIESRWKLSQEKGEGTREHIANGLASGDGASRELAAFMRATLRKEALA